MTKQEVQTILEAHEIRPLPSLSQNFLLNEDIRDNIVHAGKTEAIDHVVEIGGGIGVLTERLQEYFDTVTVFELDKTLAQILRERLYTSDKVTIYQEDVLKASSFFQGLDHAYSVIANIPYHITNRLIRFLLTQTPQPQTIVLLLQKEVAERLQEQESYSLFRLSVEMYANVDYVQPVSRVHFYPRPEVDSAVVRITPHQKYAHVEREQVLETARMAFQQKRKKLTTSVKKKLGYSQDRMQNALEQCDLSSDVRPEQLTPEDWVNLMKALQKEELNFS